jgi:hypothetical protein|tara:strand:- start:573 stop:734 length:162 start_codon:yes stop_codon:yes gene_type:complete
MKTYPLPKVLQRHGIEIMLMNEQQRKIWIEDVKRIHPDFPFDSMVYDTHTSGT